MFARKSIFSPQALPPGTFGGAVYDVDVSEPVPESAVPIAPEPPPIPARPATRCNGLDYFGFLTSLAVKEETFTERYRGLLSEAFYLREKINGFLDELAGARTQALRTRLEELQVQCRAAEDALKQLAEEKAVHMTALNEVEKKLNAATVRWREVKDCLTASRFPTPDETKTAREAAEQARLALVKVQGEATRAAERFSAWDSRMKKATEEYRRLCWEHAKVEAAIEGRELHDPATALKDVPSEEAPGNLQLSAK